MKASDGLFVYNGKRYFLDIFKAAKLCADVEKKENREREITEAFQLNEDTNEFELTSKINRELKDAGRSQNDVMSFELLKMIIARLLDEDIQDDINEKKVSLSIPLIFNTLLYYEILVEIKD